MKKLISFLVIAIIFSFSPAQAQYGYVTTVAGSGGGTFGGDGGPATADSVRIFYAKGICVDATGDLFILDYFNRRIRKVNHATGVITTIAGNGTAGYSGDGLPAPLAQFSSVATQIACDPAGNVYIADEGNSRVRKIDYTTGIITTVAGNGTYGFTSDGVSATGTSTSADVVYVDAAENIYIAGDSRIRKVNASTGIINTIIGNGTYGYSGDGGSATTAEIGEVGDLKIDAFGNIYFSDEEYNVIRKVTAAGIITTIAGNGTPGLSGDGGPATAALIQQPEGIAVDAGNNVYFSSLSHGIRQVNSITGIINTVAGTVSGIGAGVTSGIEADSIGIDQTYICMDNSGNIYFSFDDGINKITGAQSIINTLSVSDSISTPVCTLPATLELGIYGTVTSIPSPADSVTISVDYGQFATNSIKEFKMPYGYLSAYGFGSIYSSLSNFTYTIPGIYTPVLYITTLDGYTDETNAPTIQVGTNCGSTVTAIDFSVTDSFVSLPCSDPMNVRFIVNGSITGTPSTGDSAHIAYKYNYLDTFEQRVLPYTLSGSTYTFTDTVYHLCSSTGGGSGGGGFYEPYILAANSSGSCSKTQFVEPFNIENCAGGIVNIQVMDTSHLTTYCSLPFSNEYTISGWLSSWADTSHYVSVNVNYGDGTDTTFITTVYTDGHGYFYFGSNTTTHTYVLAGTCSANVTCTATPFSGTNSSDFIDVGVGCSPLTGIFYLDANLDCTYESSELLLAYWPYGLINNTTGDTTYGWCDDSGRYALELIDGDNYTMVADPYGYFGYGYTGDSLTPSCPASALYLITAVAGATYNENFAFTCSPPSEMDMSVSGWGWGFVPGDTGIVSIWSSDYLGFICDSLSSTVTLTLDPLLTYVGMWDGPPPTSISGSTLSWVFSTLDNVFDFTADVKVFTSTSAPYGASVCNTLYVSPTVIADPDMGNNTYGWCEPVNSSWDPNEKQVSPKGQGPQGYISNGTPLSYIIHFQNTGTAPASNITVSDTINTNLDIATLSIINSSSPVLVYQEPGNIIKFRFNNINLPDSTANPIGSIGYIAYNISPKPALAPGTQITNDAGIYFDYNPAVVTNSTLNTISNIGLITGAVDVCIGSSITLSDTTAGGAWSCGNAHASIAGNILTGVSAGTEVISYAVPGGSISTTINIVTPLSTPSVTGNSSVCVGAITILSGAAMGGTWTCTNGNATVSGGILTGIAPGTDTVIYTISNACGSVSTRKVESIIPESLCSSSVPNEYASQLQIFPNPATEELTIKMGKDMYGTCTITNNLGQVLLQQPLNNTQTTISISSLIPGLYFITLKGTNGTTTQKFVKM